MQIDRNTSLLALPIVSLDLETTGLDVVTDRIVQIGALEVSFQQSRLTPILDSLVNPGIPIPPLSTDFHGINDNDVVTAPSFSDLSLKVMALLNNNLIIGHHIAFDIAILRHEIARLGLDWVEPMSLDVALLTAALEPELPNTSLDSVAEWLGISVSDRHTAIGDSRAAAEIYLKLLPLLNEREIITLGDARKFLRARRDLIAREQVAGWHTAAARPRESLPEEFQERFKRLREIKEAQIDLVHTDLCKGTPANEIQKKISETNLELHQEAIGLCLRDEIDSGGGEPPVDFEAIIIGSSSRLESLLYPDQDNGFIIEDVPETDWDVVDKWFESLAKKMTEALAEIGFWYCPGWIMATNPRWRKTLQGFQEQTADWIAVAEGDALHYCNIFLDFRHFHGTGMLSKKLQEFALERARNPHFLNRLYEVHKNQTGSLGWFNKIRTDPNPGPNKGKIDLKSGGTMPIVTSIRLVSLQQGLQAQSTCDRIRQLHHLGVIERADELLSAYSLIVSFLLRQQVADFRAGSVMGNHIPPNALTRSETIELAHALKEVRKLCQQVGGILLSQGFNNRDG